MAIRVSRLGFYHDKRAFTGRLFVTSTSESESMAAAFSWPATLLNQTLWHCSAPASNGPGRVGWLCGVRVSGLEAVSSSISVAKQTLRERALLVVLVRAVAAHSAPNQWV